MTAGSATESVEAFRRRAREWIAANVPRAGDSAGTGSRARVELAQVIQRSIYDAGFAAITWPKEYGGQDLTPEHMHAFTDELEGYENPYYLLSVSLGVIGPALLDFGTAEQKATYLPPLLRGDALWVQYLSEPSGGSDMAAVLTRGTRDGDEWVLNGSKVWTTFGHYADYALCLARTDWSVPKHAGLSMFIVPVAAAGVSVVPLTQASGETEFCQEFLDDVRVPADHLVGSEGDGWGVASRLLAHERNALGGGSRLFSGGRHGGGGSDHELAQLAGRTRRSGDPAAQQLVGELHAATKVGEQLAERVATGMRTGALPSAAGSMLKLYSADLHLRRSAAAMDLLGPESVAWRAGDASAEGEAMGWLTRQGTSIMGGTSEIQRNIISERVLGLPREAAPDNGVPFNEVRTNSRAAPPRQSGGSGA